MVVAVLGVDHLGDHDAGVADDMNRPGSTMVGRPRGARCSARRCGKIHRVRAIAVLGRVGDAQAAADVQALEQRGSDAGSGGGLESARRL